MKLEARAKINWSLDITGVREDGYHLMDMLMQPVTLCDDLTLLPGDGISLETSGYPAIKADEKNLALRAANLLRDIYHPNRGCFIHLHKRIPVGAGMGGGSADAAAVLYGLNILWQLGLSQSELETVGLRLGADVPFCLRGGLARTTGIGENLQSLPCARLYWLVVIQPCKGLSTGEVFSAWHASQNEVHPDTDRLAIILSEGKTNDLHGSLYNVLQGVSSQMQPEIAIAIQSLRECGAIDAVMTGSGSAVFGCFMNASSARNALGRLSSRWRSIWMCHTDMDSIRITQR